MITADEARSIAEVNRFTYIEEKIKTAADTGLRCVSLAILLRDDEKQKLAEHGYRVITGHGGKRGPFDIISW